MNINDLQINVVYIAETMDKDEYTEFLKHSSMHSMQKYKIPNILERNKKLLNSKFFIEITTLNLTKYSRKVASTIGNSSRLIPTGMIKNISVATEDEYPELYI